MSKFVRSSKFRHLYGSSYRRDQCFDNLKVSRNAWDTNLVTANGMFVAVNMETAGGGAFAVLTHNQTGKLPENLPLVNGHSGAVLDTDFNPFNDTVIASGSEDTDIMVWKIPDQGLVENLSQPAVVMKGHGRKVGHVLFHPTAENVLASSSTDFTVKLWDITQGVEKQELTGHTEIIQSIVWNHNGHLIATTCKDKRVRIYDARANKIVKEADSHQGIKGSRVVWLGNLDKIATTGFSKTSDRQVYIWDTKNMSSPLKQEQIDTASGMLMPYYDQDSSVLFLAGKGDGNIRYYEWVDDEQGLYYLSEYKSSDPQRGVGFLPKRAVNTADVEIARAYKVHVGLVEPISFKVPRKADGFQADLYPNCVGTEPSLTAEAYFAGKTAGPKLINMEKNFAATASKDFIAIVPPPAVEEPKGPQNEKEYQDAYHALRKENEELKSQLISKDVRIRQLEAQLDKIGRR